MKKVSILGCGWLGLPLAKALLENDFDVKASTTSDNKKELLENQGIPHYEIALEIDTNSKMLVPFLEESELLIIAIPPKLRGKNKDYSDANKNSFVSKIENLLPFIEQSTVKKVLFISSTAVYGETNTSVTEETPTAPVTESGRQLVEIENLLLNQTDFKTTILRFGGLIGPDRNPARFLAGKENMPNPDAAVNLIELDDCLGIILKIIEKQAWGTIYNAVTPNHPTRKDYYTQKAIEAGLVPPTFDEEKASIGKTILSDKLIRELEYHFLKLDL